jgi:hypothetical protein
LLSDKFRCHAFREVMLKEGGTDMAATNAGPDHDPRGKPQAAIMYEEYQIYALLENWIRRIRPALVERT